MTVIKLPGSDKMSERLSDARFNAIEIPELIGLCTGVLADGTINLAEAKFILQWLNDRSNILGIWPADELHKLLCKVLADGALTAEEERELSELLEEIIGYPVGVLMY